MSIVTRTGDKGTTALMFNRRVSKAHPRVEVCGALDELNAALGLARATVKSRMIRDQLLAIQRVLVVIMGELATAAPDYERYAKAGLPVLSAAEVKVLDQRVAAIERQELAPHDWAMPGESLPAAALDIARTVCRRAERRVCALAEAGELHNPEIIIYLNRLSDLLWLLARQVEQTRRVPGKSSK